jgi:hypothetical protein
MGSSRFLASVYGTSFQNITLPLIEPQYSLLLELVGEKLVLICQKRKRSKILTSFTCRKIIKDLKGKSRQKPYWRQQRKK